MIVVPGDQEVQSTCSSSCEYATPGGTISKFGRQSHNVGGFFFAFVAPRDSNRFAYANKPKGPNMLLALLYRPCSLISNIER